MKGVGEPERERGFAGSNPAKYPDKVSGLLAEEVANRESRQNSRQSVGIRERIRLSGRVKQ